ncbi:MAG: Tll0287-like domain-containing protein [Nitrospiraceae bacterium]
MTRTSIGTIVRVAVVAMATSWSFTACGKQSATPPGIPPETVADYLHAVVEADRTFYTIQVVERLQKRGKMVASEDWRISHTLPLPAQFLMESSELAAKTGTKVRYRLIGLWPINPQNGPATEFERKGLEDVKMNPERRHSGIVTMGGERSFQAVYADRAVTQACIGCHNAHPRSPKRDFKLNDVMGGILIAIPLSQ